MSSYTLSTEEKQGQPYTLRLSGYLTIKNSLALHAQLLELATKQQGMRLEVKDVEDFDTAFIQLLLALDQYHAQHQKPYYLQLDLNPMHKKLLQVSGVSNTLYTNPS